MARGLPDGETGAVTAIQRANGDLRLSPHFHTLFLDGLYGPDVDGKGRMFHPAPAPSQEDIEQLVEKVSKRILRFLQRRRVITLVTAPGDGEVTVVTDETMGEKDPLLAKLLAAATAGVEPAGPADKRQPIRIVLDPNERPVGKGVLCGQKRGFNLQAATRVAANDQDGRERLCRYILRPPLANDRLKILDDGNLRPDFKRPWSVGTSAVELPPLALIARLAALVPPPRRFVRHHMRSPAEMGGKEIRDFLLLHHERGASASSIKMYVASLRFLYAVTLGRPGEVQSLDGIHSPRRQYEQEILYKIVTKNTSDNASRVYDVRRCSEDSSLH